MRWNVSGFPSLELWQDAEGRPQLLISLHVLGYYVYCGYDEDGWFWEGVAA